MRAQAVIGSILLLLSPLLAACGDQQETLQAGDIVKARTDDQFQDGKQASVVLPTGKLLVRTAKPLESVSGSETRTRQVVDAPAGGVLVPISWQYDPWDEDGLDGIVDTEENPVVDLVADDDSYRLPPPQLDDEDGEAFYVIASGEAESRSLEIEFDGVTQVVDLVNGRTDRGDAAGLYDIGDDALRKQSCDDGKWFDTDLAVAEFSCDRYGPVLTPYAGGRWARDDSLWLALTLETEMRVYDEADGFGGGARFVARAVTVSPEIDGEKPAFVLPTTDDTDVCPDPVTAACRWSKHLVFEVPAEEGEQGPLDLEVVYRMEVAATWGGYETPERKDVDASQEVKLWE